MFINHVGIGTTTRIIRSQYFLTGLQKTQFHLLALHISGSPQSHSSSPFKWDLMNKLFSSGKQPIVTFQEDKIQQIFGNIMKRPQPGRPRRKDAEKVWSTSCEHDFQDSSSLAPCDIYGQAHLLKILILKLRRPPLLLVLKLFLQEIQYTGLRNWN